MTLFDLELALRRPATPFGIAAAVIVAAIAVHLLVTAPLKARVENSWSESVRGVRPPAAAKTASTTATSLFEERLAAFERTLGERNALAGFVATVFEQADKHGLVLAQAEYKLELDKAGHFYTYQMTLPVRGDYRRLRGFVDAALANIPCAALEDIDFRRDAIAATESEARLRFVFFLRTER